VQTTSTTEITCRVDTNINPVKENLVGTMIVFLKTSEEAGCATNACKYTFVSTVPTITEVTPEFDTTAGKEAWRVKVTGTDFKGNKNNVSLEVGKVA
jgi:hypothetical protein